MIRRFRGKQIKHSEKNKFFKKTIEYLKKYDIMVKYNGGLGCPVNKGC